MSEVGTFEAVERVSTTEQVMRALRRAIVSGELPQGAQLREVQLAQQLGTGRSAVREAVRQLVQEGLVHHEVHRGAFVRMFTPDDIVDVYRAREAVELAAVELVLAAESVDLAPLRAALDRLREAAACGSGTWRDMAEADIAFHEALVLRAGSPRLARMAATLAAESRMHLLAYPPYSPQRNVEDHERILLALEQGSAEAVELLREHLRYSARLATEGRQA
ncbi:MAG: GntR family transcriptional regulator [Thermoleophilia bacterium]